MTDFDEDLSFAWPADHHNLLTPPESEWTYADLAWQRRRGLEGRVLGYRRAAEILHDTVIEGRSPRDLDTVVYPYVACWRHYVELQLKSLLAQLRAVLDLPVQNRHHHKIGALWQEARPLLTKASPAEATADLVSVGKIIGQLARLDPDGQAFRYSERTDGTDTLSSIDHINLRAFHAALEALANFLDAADISLHEHAAAKAEIASYYESEFGPDWTHFG